MKRHSGARLVALFLGLALCGAATAHAYEERIVTDGAGRPVFQLNFFDQGERFAAFDPDDDESNGVATWTPDASQKDAVTEAVRRWADILGSGAVNATPALINVGTYDVDNADAGSEGNDAWEGTPWAKYSGLAGALIGNQTPDVPARIRVGTMAWIGKTAPSPFPDGGGMDLVATLYHELGHALGISSESGRPPGKEGFIFGDGYEWDSHLYDQYGTPAAPGLAIYLTGEGHESDGGTPGRDFIVGKESLSGVTFRGGQVLQVLAGARVDGQNEGLPILGWENDAPELSHIELEHSLMSHQNYRNYATFMEAELAALQDLGYTIDRRNFYGFSVYGSDLTLTSNNGYFARDAAGAAYLPGRANTGTLGVGLHIYGKRNDVTQTADLLAGGAGGTGARVDGSDNTLRLAPGVRVAADGAYGTGLLVAYGKNHTVISRGEVRAPGTGGIGARFDFGHNLFGDDAEYRGSWIWQLNNAQEAITSDNKDAGGLDLNLDGPLVERFDVSGPLAGSAAAVYIADNAFVREINIMNGASLSGAIISEWDPTDLRIQYPDLTGQSYLDLTTALRFGRLAAADGSATFEADPDFRLRYDGAILGPDSIRLYVEGGTLSFNGRAEVLDVEVKEGATLGGNATYQLMTISDENSVGGTFTNGGTLAPGNSLGTITIGGDYIQTSTGRLLMEFDASGRTDRLHVAGTADVGGSLAVAPVRDYYLDPVSFSFADLVSANGALSGSLPASSAAPDLSVPSPTLAMRVDNRGGAYTVATSRAADAYSRHAANGNQRGVAGVIDARAARARGDARELIAALDFSAPDGSQLPEAYAQLGPDVYNRAGEAALAAQRGVTAALLFSRLLGAGASAGPSAAGRGASGGDAVPATRFFLTPLGGTGHWDGESRWNSGYAGALAGLETDRATGAGTLTLGAHAAFLYREDRFSGAGQARSESFSLGGHGRYVFDAAPDAYLFGLARVGLDRTELHRSVDFNGYGRRAEADWLAPHGTLALGAGRDFRLTDVLALGPAAWLDYSAAWRPPVRERGGDAIDLHLDGQWSQSLRTSLGGRLRGAIPIDRGALDAVLTVTWNHELLSLSDRARARFADLGGDFAWSGTVRERDTASAALRLTGRWSETLSLTLAGGADAGGKTHSAWGGVQCAWAF